MIEFTKDCLPFEFPDAITVRLDGRAIGTMQPSADKKTAFVCSGVGLDSNGEGIVCGDIFRAAASLLLRRLGEEGKIPRGISIV
jgi:hypothetical protein